MAAGICHFKDVEQGATFERVLTWSDATGPIDLTDYTAAMQIRPTVESSTVIADLTTENGKITLGGPAGTITLEVPATETATWSFKEAVYDLELVSPDGKVERLVKGKVILDPEVTR